MLVQIIGEACTKVPKDLRDAHPEIPWRAIIGMRHRIAHDYLEVDQDVVWAVIDEQLPILVTQVKAILAALPDDK